MDEQIENKKRPVFLIVLCVLSFFTIVLNIYSSASGLLIGGPSSDLLEVEMEEYENSILQLEANGMNRFAEMMETTKAFMSDVNENYSTAMIVTLVVSLIGFAGVLMMWRGSKKGFHVYIIYCLSAIIGMYLYASPENVPTLSIIGSALVSGLFILLYSRNLKWMK